MAVEHKPYVAVAAVYVISIFFYGYIIPIQQRQVRLSLYLQTWSTAKMSCSAADANDSFILHFVC